MQGRPLLTRILLFSPNPSPHLFARQRNAACVCALLHKNTRNPKLSAAEGICTYHSHAELFQKFRTQPSVHPCPKQATEAESPGGDTHTENLGANTQGSQLFHQLTTFRYNHTNSSSSAFLACVLHFKMT